MSARGGYRFGEGVSQFTGTSGVRAPGGRINSRLFVVPMREPHLPRKIVLQKLWLMGTENLLPAAVILFLILHIVLSKARVRTGFSRFLAENRWLVFTFVAVAMLPTFVAGVTKVGGDVNHLSLISYFVLLSAGAGLGAYAEKEAQAEAAGRGRRQRPQAEAAGRGRRQRPQAEAAGRGRRQRPQAEAAGPGGAARIFTIVFVLIGMLRMPVALFSAIGFPALRANPSQVAWTFEKAHPGVAYFPFNPLAVLLASGTLYHSDIGLKDRELSGFGIDAEQFSKYVPQAYSIVAIPKGAPAITTILRDEVQGFDKIRGTGELAGWTVYRRAANGPAVPPGAGVK